MSDPGADRAVSEPARLIGMSDEEWAEFRLSGPGQLYYRFRSISRVLGPIGIVLIYASGWGIIADRGALPIVGVVFGAGLFLTGLALQFSARSIRETFRAEQLLQSRERALATAARVLPRAEEQDPVALAAFWQATNQRLDSYHAEAGAQLRGAYRLAQLSAIAGFVVVMALGTVAAFAQSGPQSAVAGGVATAGAALAAFIGKTFQATYERSLEQRMSYFEQPVIAARLLAAERLLPSFTDAAARDQALLTVVQAAVSFGVDAREV